MSAKLWYACACTPIILAVSVLPVAGCVRSRGGSTPRKEGVAQQDAPLHLEVPPLPAREALPDEAREMLHGRMMRHGEEMLYLMTSVLILDYAGVAYSAGRLAGTPKLGRPAAGETDTLNAMLPAAFFVHQDELAMHARSLEQAAKALDDQKLVSAFASLTTSCVGCHAAYLDNESVPLMQDGPDDRDIGASEPEGDLDIDPTSPSGIDGHGHRAGAHGKR